MRTSARLALPVVATLFVACCVAQVFLAGLGVFYDPAAFVTHREFGYLFGWLTIVMLALSLVGRLPRGIVGQTALLLVLFALQSVFVALRVDMPAIAAIHPLNGFAILLVGVMTARASWSARRYPTVLDIVPAGAAPVGASGEAR